MAKKNILILGGLGFIGRNLTTELAADYSLVVFDRNRTNLESGIKTFVGDFFNAQDLEDVLQTEHFDIVIHLVSSTIPANDNPVFDIESNLVGTVRLLDLLKKYRVPKIVFASSGGTIYGNIDEQATVNEQHPTNPISSYGVIKLAIEKYIMLYHHLHGLNYLILRYSNPYGQHHQSEDQGIINLALKKILRAGAVDIRGDGSTIRDFIYVHDLAVITRRLIADEVTNEIINVSTGIGYSINDIFEILHHYVGDFQVIKKPAGNFEIPRIVLDNTLLISKLNYSFTPIADGIRQTYDWLKSGS